MADSIEYTYPTVQPSTQLSSFDTTVLPTRTLLGILWRLRKFLWLRTRFQIDERLMLIQGDVCGGMAVITSGIPVQSVARRVQPWRSGSGGMEVFSSEQPLGLQTTFSATISLGPPGQPPQPPTTVHSPAMSSVRVFPLHGSSVLRRLGFAVTWSTTTTSSLDERACSEALVAAMSAKYRLPGAVPSHSYGLTCRNAPGVTADTCGTKTGKAYNFFAYLHDTQRTGSRLPLRALTLPAWNACSLGPGSARGTL